MGKEVHQMLEAITGSFSKTKQEITETVDLKKYPLVSEPALVHPSNSSTMKIRENGMIDIFVGTDNGIRIDPNERNISLLSNKHREKNTYHWSDTIRNRTENVGGDYVQNVKNDMSQNIKGNWTVHSAEAINLVSDGDIYMEARNSITMKSPEINLDATLPKDELDKVRPVLGLMFEEDSPYGQAPPFGYQYPHGAYTKEKKPYYRREEFDDMHTDKYETEPSFRGLDKIRKDLNEEYMGPILRKKYKESRINITANKHVAIKGELIDLNEG